jgi:hypothetical protein
MRERGVLDKKSYQKGCLHFRNKSKESKRKWRTWRDKFIQDHPADENSLVNYRKHTKKRGKKKDLRSKLKKARL